MPASIIGLRTAPAALLLAGSLLAFDTIATSVLEEVIVTAQKRAETALETPLAISAFDQGTLERNGVLSTEDLSMLVPNFKFGDLNLGFGGAQVTIRGISNDAITNVGDPSIAVHLDGVYLPRISSANALFYDVERVEVLRGPQGTLYGRNTTSGTINVIPRRPTDQIELSGAISAGSDSLVTVEGAGNAPLIDGVLAGRVAFNWTDRDGLRDNDPAPDGDDAEHWAVRGSLLYTPTDTISFLLSADYFEQNGHGTAMAAIAFTPEVEPSGSAFQFPFSMDPQEFPLNIDPETDNFDWGVKGELNWELPFATLTYIGGYRAHQRAGVADRDGTDQIPAVADLCRFAPPPLRPACLSPAAGPTLGNFAVTDWQSDSISQEIRLASNDPQSLWEWLGGFYYFYETQDVAFDAVVEGLRGTGFIAPVLGAPPPVLFASPATRVNRFDDQTAESLAAFGQLSRRFGPQEQFRITGGFRFTYEEKDLGNSYVGFTLAPLTAPAPGFTRDDLVPNPTGFPTCSDGTTTVFRCLIQDQRASWNEWTWKAGADWRPTEDWLLYYSATRGFRSGGFDNAGNKFGPEKILAHEAGAKGRLWGGRAQVDLTAFYYDFTDQQVNQVESAQIVTRNAGASTLWGIEFTGIVLPTENSRIDLTIGFLDTEFDEFVTADPQLSGPALATNPDKIVDLSGSEFAKAPDLSLNLGVEPHIFRFGDGSTLTPRVNFHYESEFSLLVFDNPQNRQDSFTRTDLRLTYRSAGGNWSIEGWVKNIEDDDVLAAQFTTPNNLLPKPNLFGAPPGPAQELLLGSYAPPRTFGVTLRATFR